MVDCTGTLLMTFTVTESKERIFYPCTVIVKKVSQRHSKVLFWVPFVNLIQELFLLIIAMVVRDKDTVVKGIL